MHQLHHDGYTIGRYRVRHLMIVAGISVTRKRKYKVTTRSNYRHPLSPNLIQRNFHAIKPNMVWVVDITYVKTIDGCLYLGLVLDLCSHKVRGWSLAKNMTTEMVKQALIIALVRRNPSPGLIHPSYQGIQYACDEYRRLLRNYGIVNSISGCGNCLANAVAERFFCTLKTETLYNWQIMPAEEVKHDVVNFIELFYNSERLNSTDGYQSHNDYRKLQNNLN